MYDWVVIGIIDFESRELDLLKFYQACVNKFRTSYEKGKRLNQLKSHTSIRIIFFSIDESQLLFVTELAQSFDILSLRYLITHVILHNPLRFVLTDLFLNKNHLFSHHEINLAREQ